MWAGLRKSNRDDDHLGAGSISDGARRRSRYWDPGSEWAVGRRKVPDASCVLWLRDETHSWQLLWGGAKKMNTRAPCSSISLISSHHSSFVKGYQKTENKEDLWCVPHRSGFHHTEPSEEVREWLSGADWVFQAQLPN